MQFEFNPIKSINQIDFRLNTACGTTFHDDPQSLCVSPLPIEELIYTEVKGMKYHYVIQLHISTAVRIEQWQ